MEFSSIIFLGLFLPLFFVTYFLFKKRNIRNLIILLFSMVFYAWGGGTFLFLVILSVIVNYYLAILISREKHKKLYLILSIIFDLGILGIFKYTDFAISSVNNIFNLHIPLQNIVLPIGISFYTFQILSYVIDVYRKEVEVQRNILNLGCYILAFPQLIAGPIVRYKTVEKELSTRKENIKDASYGVRRFIKGLGKKILIANNVGLVAKVIFSYDVSTYGFIGSWIGMMAYTLQIYYDFSGYSDMAIGIGRILGFKYLENFNYPYIANSITDFWRRWHISLSSFFRDYVYIPLGGNRVSKGRFIFNILVVWALTGLWHGAAWNFVLWGLYYGIILLLEKLVLNKVLDKLPNSIRHIYTLLIIIVGWVFFRSESLKEIKNILMAMAGLKGLGNISLYAYAGLITVNAIVAFVIGIILARPLKIKWLDNKPFIKDMMLLLILILAIMEIVIGTYNPFIYFRF